MCSGCKTVEFKDYYSENVYTWCTNCGNYGITSALKRALVNLQIAPHETLMCFDIGCNGNGSDKINAYTFHGLHGRVIPFATGAALANKNVNVIASGGDGATLSEGINHLIHAVKSNYNIVFILHNNYNYGLTKGQASSTTPSDMAMNSSPDGRPSDSINASHLVLSLQPSFVARSFSGNVDHMTHVLQEAIKHKGFSFVEIFQSCPTYNKATPHEWFYSRIKDVNDIEQYNNTDIDMALQYSQIFDDIIPIGIIYQDKAKLDFLSRLENRVSYTTELVDEVKNYNINELLKLYN
jgi:2-oxoglutarate/2-oxoacid ferredoxin oxidoreductase subunit beta